MQPTAVPGIFTLLVVVAEHPFHWRATSRFSGALESLTLANSRDWPNQASCLALHVFPFFVFDPLECSSPSSHPHHLTHSFSCFCLCSVRVFLRVYDLSLISSENTIVSSVPIPQRHQPSPQTAIQSCCLSLSLSIIEGPSPASASRTTFLFLIFLHSFQVEPRPSSAHLKYFDNTCTTKPTSNRSYRSLNEFFKQLHAGGYFALIEGI